MSRILRALACAICLGISPAALSDVKIFDGGVSGEWFNQQRDGEGFFIEVVQQTAGRAIVVSWFTYDLGQQIWLVGVASLQTDTQTVTIPVQISDGTDFGAAFDPEEVERTDWGTLTFRFPTCDTAVLDYASDLDFGTGTINLVRLTSLVGLGCSEQ